MGKEGGTNMYCPHCKKIQPCSAAPFVKSNSNHQQYQSKKYPDLHWFERGRLCPDCFKGFTTVEINKKHLHELIALRDLKAELEKVTYECIEKSGHLTKNFKKLLELVAPK